MKVSDAMRLADEMRLPDLRGAFIDDLLENWHGEKPPCCAIGGASVASRSFVFERRTATPQMLTNISVASAARVGQCSDARVFDTNKAACPVVGCVVFDTLSGLAQDLYDNHLWSRTQIADWLDSLDAEAQS